MPYGDIRSVGEVCEAEQLSHRGMIIEMDHSTAGVVKNIASPFRFDDRKDRCHGAPPLLGQHTTETLTSYLGLSNAEVHDLNRAWRYSL